MCYLVHVADLPQDVADAITADIYDEAMLEFYYFDRQTLANGIIAINTYKSKGRKDVLKFIKKYRPSYKIAETDCGITLIQRDTIPSGVSHS